MLTTQMHVNDKPCHSVNYSVYGYAAKLYFAFAHFLSYIQVEGVRRGW